MTGMAGHDPGISGHVRPESLVTLLRNTHVESMGGKLELVAKFPDRPPVVIGHIGGYLTLKKRGITSRRVRAAA